MVCTTASCQLSFTDEGPGTLGTNISTQTIDANFDLDGNDNITGSGTATLLLTGGARCTKNFDALGDVLH
jgi:hypothetical protein